MSELPACPKCNSAFVYEDNPLYICPECAHEWPITTIANGDENNEINIVKDANATELRDGDTVTVITTLIVKYQVSARWD